MDRIFVGASPTTSPYEHQPDPPIGLVLLPLFSHFRVPYKSSGPGLMLSNEKRQGHTMLVDDVSSLRPQCSTARDAFVCRRIPKHGLPKYFLASWPSTANRDALGLARPSLSPDESQAGYWA